MARIDQGLRECQRIGGTGAAVQADDDAAETASLDWADSRFASEARRMHGDPIIASNGNSRRSGQRSISIE
jgi:hypothetical protein